jgi:hypothetical protein
MTAITVHELKSALEALEVRGQFKRRQFKSVTLWRRV